MNEITRSEKHSEDLGCSEEVYRLLDLCQRRHQSPDPNVSSFPRLKNLLNDTETLPKQFINEFKDLV